jgi:hypothetical protein
MKSFHKEQFLLSFYAHAGFILVFVKRWVNYGGARCLIFIKMLKTLT